MQTGLGRGLCQLALLIILLTLPTAGFTMDDRAVVIEDFESGNVVLDSYPEQDHEPGAWELSTSQTHAGSDYALRIHGNSWKLQSIPAYEINSETVWQVAVYIEDIGEMQGFGVGDGVSELIYTIAGRDVPQGMQWWTVYQGAYWPGEWRVYLLPIGEDWLATHGYLPELNRLIYVNDNDGSGGVETFFDSIADVSDDLPVAPELSISRSVRNMKDLGGDRFRAEVQFYAEVVDPDSESHDFHWDFGDSAFSAEQNPLHDFIVSADHDYTVSCLVTDPDGRFDSDTLQVGVEDGPGDLPLTINFAGDIMIGRNYESNGGIIDTYGVDAIFEPTKAIFGEAADVSMVNLEVPFTDQGVPHPTKSVVFRARPSSFIGVVNAGIEMVDLANNHIIDYGEIGMLQTMELCEQHGISYHGAGVSDYFALRPAFRSEKGVRMAFLGLSNRTGRRWNFQPYLDAGASKCGFAYLLPKNLEKCIPPLLEQADVVIVQTHSGDEYQTSAPGEDDPGGAYTDPGANSLTDGTAPDMIGRYDPELLIEGLYPPADAPDFRFRIEPTPGERQLRRMALDLGADILINHHPHVLQGFESYDGKLIAHSLGNFIFDLSYPETMPTIVFTLEIDKSGIVGYSFVPAWIDDWITQPATGQLGREIIDRLADYSLPMGAIVAYEAQQNRGRIYLSLDDTQPATELHEQSVPCRVEGTFALSRPLELTGPGSLSRIVDVLGDELDNYEISFGREILWHGNFEDEGATLWDDNTSDEWLDDTEFFEGARSLALRRNHSDGNAVGTDLERHLPCLPEKRHSFAARIKTVSAGPTDVLARFYESRYASQQISSTPLGESLTGDNDWLLQWAELETPENANYFELRCTMDPPQDGDGFSWFDELAFIEWDDWQTGEADLTVPNPGNYRFIQIRGTNTALAEVTVFYEETTYAHVLTAAPDETVSSAGGRLAQNYPNPFNPTTMIELSAPAGNATRASLEIFDVQGRLVDTLFRGILQGGERRSFTWDGRDEQGERQASGVYFSRARLGDRIETRKMIMLK